MFKAYYQFYRHKQNLIINREGTPDFLNLGKFTPNDLRTFKSVALENKIDGLGVFNFSKLYYSSHVTIFQKMIVKNFNWKYFD